VRRAEVWWAELPLPAGRRPVVLLSRNEAYQVRENVTVAPVTTRIRGIPTEVTLGPREGLRRLGVANLDSIVTVPKSLLRSRIAKLPPAKVDAVNRAIKFALDLP
jgi:mRNA interferase MazF